MVKVADIGIGGDKTTVLIAGPCAIENEEMTLATASALRKITSKMGIPFIFKASFDKANRLSIESERGVGLTNGLKILLKVKETLGLPILTDIHESYQAEAVASVADIVQIPAFLSRQTDILLAAAATKKVINIKKGQFLAPEDMKYIAGKALSVGCKQIILTDRGTSFGYHDLVLDPRGIIYMKRLGYPVILDVTHTTQKPGAAGGSTGGDRSLTPHFIRLGFALGVDGIYMEVHPDPKKYGCHIILHR